MFFPSLNNALSPNYDDVLTVFATSFITWQKKWVRLAYVHVPQYWNFKPITNWPNIRATSKLGFVYIINAY